MKLAIRTCFCIIAGSFAACNESLPAREDVSGLFTSYVRSLYETTQGSVQPGKIRLFLTMINKTDETLDDVVSLTGKFEIDWQVPLTVPPMVVTPRTMLITPDDIFYAKKYDRHTKRLIVEPNDSVVVSVVWDLTSNDGTYLLKYFPVMEEETCYVYTYNKFEPVPRKITLPQWFVVTANIKLFDRLSMIYPKKVAIKHCIMIAHVKPLPGCADFTKVDPCSVIKQ